MFNTIIGVLTAEIENHSSPLKREQHQALLEHLFALLESDADYLLGAAEVLFSRQLQQKSHVDYEYRHTPTEDKSHIDMPIIVGTMVICPDKDDRSACLNLNICRPYKNQRGAVPAEVEIELETNDLASKLFFRRLLSDYRAEVSRLLKLANLRFFTSYCSSIVGNSKSKEPAVLLEEFFSDPNAGMHFSLAFSAKESTSAAAVFRAFLTLALLYSAYRAVLDKRSWRAAFELNLRKLL